MTSQLSRRDFLRAAALVSASLTLHSAGLSSSFAQSAPQKRWYKGNLHTHNQWSDGKQLPECAVDWYKSRGYNFLCPSDHNIFQSNDLRFNAFGCASQLKEGEIAAFEGETSFWKPLSTESSWARLPQRSLDEAIEKFGKDSIRTKVVGGTTYVRMTTFDELAEKFCESEKFLMIPGFEQTGVCQEDERAVHMNFINVRQTFPYIAGKTPLDTFDRTFKEGAELYAGQKYLFTANHPEWRYYDFSPSDMIALPRIRVFEILNNDLDGSFESHPDAWSPEKFWDVVNAWRAAHDQRLLLGMGSDDRHGYDDPNPNWSVVRAAKLDVDSILDAIDDGDMYASTGLDFIDVRFDGKTLEVKIDPKDEGEYRIDFIGTKKDYDPTCQTFEVEKGPKSPRRVVERYSDKIGVVLETVEGTEGAYTLKADDLYVRAKAVKINKEAKPFWRARNAAWTQPYRS